MKIGSVADVKAKFSAYLKEAKGGPVVVTRNGKPVGVLLSVENDEELERLILAYSPRFQAILAGARQQIHVSLRDDGELLTFIFAFRTLGSSGTF